jgi:hypothetical protein
VNGERDNMKDEREKREGEGKENKREIDVNSLALS